MSILKSHKADPRTAMESGALDDANHVALSPVAMPSGMTPGMKLGFAGIALLAILTFTTLANSRSDAANGARTNGKNATVAAAVAPPGGLVPAAVLKPGPPELPAPSLVPPPIDGSPVLGIVGPRSGSGIPGSGPAINRFESPGVVVDTTKGGAALLPPTPGLEMGKGAGINPNDSFADRVSASENAPARAERIANTSFTVPQGAIIAGTLETAINSDLPGYVRAVVTRDVMGFDGRRVLIPSGSRLIGQYKSGLAAGQSRAFIVWTRLTRPDGVSVALGSPATDTLGRAGLTGKVNSHFFKRFGSALLLSVVDSGLSALRGGNTNNIVIRSADDARSAAGAALQGDMNIPPTVKVAQGTAIRIFIARDLDFSGTDSARP